MRTFDNSEVPDEMLNCAVFHKMLQCLLNQQQQKRHSKKEIRLYLEIIT